MEFSAVKMIIPEGANIILGQSHFIKTVEDLYEIMATQAGPGARFGIAFSEASGPCLIRSDGNAEGCIAAAVENVKNVASGHFFCIVMKDCFPISVLNAVKGCQEVVGVFCATANPVEVVVAQTDAGRGVMGVIDGESPKGTETEKDATERRDFLMKIGYKR
jgi:hypothetical protein